MDRKKYVCLIYEFLSEQGGLERELINHANFLKEAGYEVELLTCHLDSKILSLLPFEGIKIREISIFKTKYEWLNLALCFMGLNKLNAINPDLFITYSFPTNYLIRNKKNKKINYVNHYPHFLYLSDEEKAEWADGTQGIKRKIVVWISRFLGIPLRALDRKLIKKNDLILINSSFTKKKLDKLYNMNSIVSYPPLDKRFHPVKESIKEKFVFSSSRIIPDKKYEWLIEAMSFSKSKLPLYLAGSVEDIYKSKLLDFAKEKNVKVRFLGRLTTQEILSYYSSAQVFAFPTPGEDFGLVPAESLSCGTPVIVWNDGAGPTEQITDGVTGFLAKPYDKEDFGKKIDLCIKSNLKKKNRKKIISSANKFSYLGVKNSFLQEIAKVI